MNQRVTFTNDVGVALCDIIGGAEYSSVFVLIDDNVYRHVWPRLKDELPPEVIVMTIAAGEQHKTLDTLTAVWTRMIEAGTTRRSLMINLGGGVVSDLGGFAAATYRRGIDFVNVPTTVLAAVDAAVGGKTGIDFGGLKNEIGAFKPACEVIVSSCFFDTLPHSELLSGYAEMIKHAMLSGHDAFLDVTGRAPDGIGEDDMLDLLRRSVQVKSDIVAQDPHELGLRKALNYGHTVGHAFESFALAKSEPIRHGYAVAWGLVVETVLSHTQLGFPSEDLYRLKDAVRNLYGVHRITCDDYPTLLKFMHCDKKSSCGEINCTLLRQCGDVALDQTVDDEQMSIALDIYRDLMGI